MPTSNPPPSRSNPDAVGVDQRRHTADERRRPSSDRMRLPHERDESPRPGTDPALEPVGPRDAVEQAARDVARGLVDTERRGTPNDLPRPVRRSAGRGGGR